MVEQGRADEEALLMALQREAAAVDDQLAALVDAHLDVMLDPLLVRLADHRAVMRLGVGRDADAQRFDRRDQLFAQRVGGLVADRHDHRQRHAALAGRAEGGAGKVVDDLVEVGVGHDDAVVLGAAEGLDALPVRGAARVDILRDVGRADEADRGDVGMVEDRVDHFLVAVDDVEDAVGQARFLHQLGEADRHATGRAREGLRMKALPQAIAMPNIHIGIIAGKLNGVMPAPMPSGWRIE